MHMLKVPPPAGIQVDEVSGKQRESIEIKFIDRSIGLVPEIVILWESLIQNIVLGIFIPGIQQPEIVQIGVAVHQPGIPQDGNRERPAEIGRMALILHKLHPTCHPHRLSLSIRQILQGSAVETVLSGIRSIRCNHRYPATGWDTGVGGTPTVAVNNGLFPAGIIWWHRSGDLADSAAAGGLRHVTASQDHQDDHQSGANPDPDLFPLLWGSCCPDFRSACFLFHPDVQPPVELSSLTDYHSQSSANTADR